LTARSAVTQNFVLEPLPPATVKGTIFGNFGTATRVLESAEVTVINEDTKAAVAVQFSQGVYTFTVPAGRYKITVKATRFNTVEEVLPLKPGSAITKDFTLTRNVVPQ
jgi:Carboxypeptidase regulatory-like domain